MAGRALLLRPRPCDSREDAQPSRSASIMQDYRDLAKLFARPESASARTRALRCALCRRCSSRSSFMLAMGLPHVHGSRAPCPVFGDAITIMYSAGARPASSSPSAVWIRPTPTRAIGGIRELLMSVLIEPSMLHRAVHRRHRVRLHGHCDHGSAHRYGQRLDASVAVILAGVAFAAACYMELGKLPFDQAEAEQELQEGPLAELSGPSLAMMKLAMGMKQVVVVAWFTSIFIPWGEPATIGVTAARGRRRLPRQVPGRFRRLRRARELLFPVRASRCSVTRPGPSSASRSSRSSSSS